MPNINFKSTENLSAAQKLIQNKMYSSSVHCSYYSCLLKMKYIISKHEDTKNSKYPISYIDQESKFNGKDSHKEILKEICNRITSQIAIRNIRTDFEKLKDDRVNADYKEKIFTELECFDDLGLANAILAKLNNAFNFSR